MFYVSIDGPSLKQKNVRYNRGLRVINIINCLQKVTMMMMKLPILVCVEKLETQRQTDRQTNTMAIALRFAVSTHGVALKTESGPISPGRRSGMCLVGDLWRKG